MCFISFLFSQIEQRKKKVSFITDYILLDKQINKQNEKFCLLWKSYQDSKINILIIRPNVKIIHHEAQNKSPEINKLRNS